MPKKVVNRLTALKVSTREQPGLLADGGGGLYLQVAASGAKSWIFRYQLGGRWRDMGLGSAPSKAREKPAQRSISQTSLARAEVSICKACEKPVQRGNSLRRGVDPIEARKAERRGQR
jgi:Arm DNA-binding domain